MPHASAFRNFSWEGLDAHHFSRSETFAPFTADHDLTVDSVVFPQILSYLLGRLQHVAIFPRSLAALGVDARNFAVFSLLFSASHFNHFHLLVWRLKHVRAFDFSRWGGHRLLGRDSEGR